MNLWTYVPAWIPSGRKHRQGILRWASGIVFVLHQPWPAWSPRQQEKVTFIDIFFGLNKYFQVFNPDNSGKKVT